MMVKICGITQEEDALAAIEGGAAALGFNFYRKSPRYLAPDAAARIFESLPPAVWKVGVFVNENGAGVARRIGLDVVQIHGEPGALPAGTRVWRALRVDDTFRVGDLECLDAEAFLLDTPSETLHGGTGRTFDWSRAAGATRKVILAGGLDAVNVGDAIRAARPWGVDACSRIESAPGRKDHKKMLEFLRAAHEF